MGNPNSHVGFMRCEVEVRRAFAETITYQKQGQRRTLNKLTIGAEALGNGQPMVISHPLPQGADVATVKVPFKRGDKLMVLVQSAKMEMGVWQVWAESLEVYAAEVARN